MGQTTLRTASARSLIYFNLIFSAPCQHYFCAFGAKCLVNGTDNSAYCECRFRCKPVFAPVCGSDGVTYSSQCLLGKSSCVTQRRIKVSRPGECGKHVVHAHVCVHECVHECLTTPQHEKQIGYWVNSQVCA